MPTNDTNQGDAMITIWACSADGETWSGPFSSRTKAISEGLVLATDAEADCFEVAPCTMTDVRVWGPQADEVLDWASEAIRDNVWDESEPIDVTPEAESALQVLLDAAWDAWVRLFDVKHGSFTVDTARSETIRLNQVVAP